jgi:hypothetical protein
MRQILRADALTEAGQTCPLSSADKQTSGCCLLLRGTSFESGLSLLLLQHAIWETNDCSHLLVRWLPQNNTPGQLGIGYICTVNERPLVIV